MKVPLDWLAEYVDLVLPPEELADRLTFAGLEVSDLQRIGDFWDREKILVAEIVAVEQHPDADRLTIAEVEYGQGRRLKVVTGAPNIKVGMTGIKAPFALEGSTLIDGYADGGRRMILKKSRIRGVESAGMVLSEKEIGLSEEHKGIMILPDEAPVGLPLVDYLGDTVMEFDLTPNLSRCLSIIGVAREVAALTGRTLRYEPAGIPRGDEKAEDLMSISIADERLSSRYCGTYIGGVKIGPSPFLIQRRLMACGMRPINNVVDVTNYVMLELGQPLHAFDYALLKERAGGNHPRIIVRPAEEGEVIITLDGVERKTAADTLLIADSRGAIAVAGVMGGSETEVGEETTEILLESANFNHGSIRRTSARLKLPSQASLRFGKGIPPSLAMEAAGRATALMAEVTGGRMAAGVVDCYPVRQKKVKVDIELAEFSRLLGHEITKEKIISILKSLEFSVEDKADRFLVDVPDHRLDVTIPADLIEEVIRIEGFDKLPATLMKEYLPPQSRDRHLEVENLVKDIMTGCGLQEVINYSIVDEQKDRRWMELAEESPSREFIELANPLSEDRTVLRVSLVPELLANLSANRRYLKRVAIFETGRVFQKKPGEERPDEPYRLGLIIWGMRQETWWQEPRSGMMDFFDLKGIVHHLFSRLGLTDLRFESSGRPCLQDGRGMEVFLGGSNIGYLGELSGEARSRFDLEEGRIGLAEIDLDPLIEACRTPAFEAPARFPAVVQDIALVIDEDLSAARVEREIRKAGGGLLREVTVFDLYRGEHLPEGKKSLAFSLLFQAQDRTLVEEEVNHLREKIVRSLEKGLNASLRGR